MGQVGSRGLYVRGVKRMLADRGVRVSRDQLDKFLEFVDEICPWFPEEGTVILGTWLKIGDRIQDFYTAHGPRKVPVDMFNLWTLIRDALDFRHEGVKMQAIKAAGASEGEEQEEGNIKTTESQQNSGNHAHNILACEGAPPPEQLEEEIREEDKGLDPSSQAKLEEEVRHCEEEKEAPMVALGRVDSRVDCQPYRDNLTAGIQEIKDLLQSVLKVGENTAEARPLSLITSKRADPPPPWQPRAPEYKGRGAPRL